MSQAPQADIPDGAFVWCHFPFGDPPGARVVPGPAPHIVYCLGGRAAARRVTEYLVAYTSSGPWRGPSPAAPIGVIDVDEAAAAALNQIAFHLDLRCLARIPPSAAWFPHWSAPHRGVVAIADARLKRRILAEAARLAKHAGGIIDVRGIGGAGVTISPRKIRVE